MIITIILTVTLTISIAVNVALGVAISKGIEREKIYADWIIKFRNRVEEIYRELKSIDEKHIFEKDDEVGVVFSELVNVMKEFDDEVK
jgi:hypothetical protein